ncbi:cryptochrome/photolyase family protein [Limnobacter parvus]|uniref:Cryptochrome/photolyase family protein n=1 Tax=Limnobacter parvus TaxID=2939690 RepID=A0ABT1XEC0_9BURK|nr:cryptochrome/photolyase family protein [Limnobacter parvus]MCR2745616.1 cryptochrome/photolyase family protein [Limnobacter parvus]
MSSTKHAVVVLGDQLDLKNPALLANPPETAHILMVESPAESTVVWVHKVRIALFLSAMRHFAEELRKAGYAVHYRKLGDTGKHSLVEGIGSLCKQHGYTSIDMAEPGEWRLEQDFLGMAKTKGIKLRLLDDTHYLCTRAEFAKWASGYKQMRMEYFYREMRKRTGVLMEGAEPAGGKWNFDTENRSAFPKSGPGTISPPAAFEPDEITKEVFAEVEQHFPKHPGTLANFQWPVTREQALKALDTFIATRFTNFGNYQDAMWTNTPFGWHSLVSSSINLHLLHPMEVVEKAEAAFRENKVDIASAEGFIRQILGWREFMRGVYWLDMPKMRDDNFLQAKLDLPKWFWTGKTQMNCLKDSIGQTMDHGYAHHIQRLMVIGNFALLAGLVPQQVEDWFLAVYVDAIEWVELPNVAGMALFANGGRFTSKPYIASGAYIKRMSNYCTGCKYKPSEKVGDDACPFTTLYWGFLDQHEKMLSANPRTGLMAKNIARLDDAQRTALRQKVADTFKNIEQL